MVFSLLTHQYEHTRLHRLNEGIFVSWNTLDVASLCGLKWLQLLVTWPAYKLCPVLLH